MTNTAKTIAADIAALLRARNPLLWVVTREEARAERYLFEAAEAANYTPRTWDVAQGVCRKDGEAERDVGSPDPGDTLAAIGECAAGKGPRCVWILRDLPIWFQGQAGAQVTRRLRNLARTLPTAAKSCAQAVIVLSPSGDVPPELAGHATVIEWPLPDREEITGILDAAVENLPEEIKANAAPNGTRDAAVDAAVGLTGEEAAACYAKSLVQLRRIDPAAVAGEKKRVIAREKVLEWFDPLPGGLDAVGGLELLKAWLVQRRQAYSPAARAYGLPAPKGALLVGVPGCGKSLTAKAIATAWGIPLLRVDLGALKSKFVGESESNLRKAFDVIRAIGRCVVWFDEIEKALSGATQGAADGGVSSDALGAILSWMQDRQGEAFVIATANDVSGLPPELLRKGRFDEVWFVDLPTPLERRSIAVAALKANGRGSVRIDLEAFVGVTDQFTGAEIAACVPDALFRAFGEDAREIIEDDLIEAAKTVVPLSKTAAEKITALRNWAAGRARFASKPVEVSAPKSGRQIDL